MNFSTDRDLLTLEPHVFRDVPFLSQQRVSVTDGVISGTTLTSASADFVASQVEAGSVVLVNDVAHEVLSRTDANTLSISLPRASLTDAAIPSGDGSTLTVMARTFDVQASLVHDSLYQLTRMGILEPSNRPAIDLLFHQMLRRDGMGRFRAWYFYRAVRMFGGAAIKPSKPEPVREAP